MSGYETEGENIIKHVRDCEGDESELSPSLQEMRDETVSREKKVRKVEK